MTAFAPNRTQALAYGYAQAIGVAGIGFTWRASGHYEPTELGLWIGSLPAKPTEAVAVRPFPLSKHPAFTDDVEGLQFHVRAGDRLSRMWAIRDAVEAFMRGRFPLRLPTGLHVVSTTFSGGADLPLDADRRHACTSTWAVRTGALHPAA